MMCAWWTSDAEVGERDVRVKIKFCGVCGTELHIFTASGRGAGAEGTVIGQSFPRRVDAVGAR
jgi:threonine dehydrogenase-like Zn-dependent dehydrogenase